MLGSTFYVTFVLLKIAPQQAVTIWLAGFLLTLVVRRVLQRQLANTSVDARRDTLQLLTARVVMPMTGVVVGITPLVLLSLDASAEHLALLFFVALLVTTGAVLTYGAYDLVTFSAYAVAAFLPFVFYVGYAGRWFEAAAMVPVIYCLWPFARGTNALVMGAIEAREALRVEKAAAELARSRASRSSKSGEVAFPCIGQP